MILSLEVSAPQEATPGAPRRQVFNEAGGTIGRGNDSSWVLPYTEVSSLHALISYRNSVFYIEDRSKNGVCLNSSENRLVPRRPYALKSGDRIFIGPCEIHVSISASNQSARRPLADPSEGRLPAGHFDESDPFHDDDPFAQRGVSLGGSSPVTPASEANSGEELDPLKLLDPSPRPAPARKAPRARDLVGSLLEGHYQPPEVLRPSAAPPQPDAGLIPHGYDPLAPDDSGAIPPVPSAPPPSEPVPTGFNDTEPSAPPPIPHARPSPGAGNPRVTNAAPAVTTDAGSCPDLADMLAGAGLDGADVTPELVRNFGQILRVVVSGVMDVLQARQQIKDEFRMRMTHFQPADNNPLKFSANVDDALHNLLVKRNAAYLDPIEAFADAFEDLRNHQIAMLAGMRVAFETMLAEFDPDRLQEQFDRQLNKGSLLSVPAKLRYWDLYRDARHDMVKDPEASFSKLFGEEFARAYEEQFRRLKAEGRAGTRKGPAATPRQHQK